MITMLAFSCYEDKGNYDYDYSVNDINVVMRSVYGTRMEAQTFTITPTIEQSRYTGTDNLSFAWFVSDNPNEKGTEFGTDDHINIVIDPAEANFRYNRFFRLYITDVLTGIEQMFFTELRIAKPYEGAWMILHHQEGISRIASLEYLGNDMVIDNDAYYSKTGHRLSGTGYSLGVFHAYSPKQGNSSLTAFFAFTSNPEESGMLAQDDNFRLVANTQRMFPVDLASFDPAKIYGCRRMIGGGVIASNGYVFQGANNSGAMGRAVLDNAAAEDSPDFYISHIAMVSQSYLLFDGLNNRFLQLYTRDNTTWVGWSGIPDMTRGRIERIRNTPLNNQSIDPNNIGSDKQMVYMGSGHYLGFNNTAPWQRYTMYAYAVNRDTPKSHIFVFHSRPMLTVGDNSDPAPFTEYYVIDTPAGVDGNTLMASSIEYNRILFYAIDNKIYRLDFALAESQPTLIWQHPDPGATPIALKFADDTSSNRDIGSNYPDAIFPLDRTLGIAYNMPDGSGELVVLVLNSAGRAEEGMHGGFPTVQRHTVSADGRKFGAIKDIVFI